MIADYDLAVFLQYENAIVGVIKNFQFTKNLDAV